MTWDDHWPFKGPRSRWTTWAYLAIQVADGWYHPGLTMPVTAREWIALRQLARRMPGHE